MAVSLTGVTTALSTVWIQTIQCSCRGERSSKRSDIIVKIYDVGDWWIQVLYCSYIYTYNPTTEEATRSHGIGTYYLYEVTQMRCVSTGHIDCVLMVK